MNHKHIEGTGKPTKVVAPDRNCPTYLEPNKEYKVRASCHTEDNGWYFEIETILPITREIGAVHLNGGNWIVTEREEPTTESL